MEKKSKGPPSPPSSHTLDEIIRCVENQNRWRGHETLNMIASENVMSETATRYVLNDFEHRYAEGLVGKRGYQGQKYQDEIEQICIDLTRKTFDADYVDVRAPTATTANLAVYYGLAKPQDIYFSLPVPAGAHISFRKFGGAGCRNLQIQDIPYKEEVFNIDTEALIEQIKEKKPKLLTLGGSVYLFPHPVKEVAKVCHEVGTILHYDGSHVLGLIAAGEFQQPLAEGADLLVGSTHKTFPGPQGAIIATNTKKIIKKIRKAIFPGLVSNHHLWRFPSLAITMLEMQQFGSLYAKQIISNAKALGAALDRVGIPVLAKEFGYTASHQILVDVSEFGGGGKAAVNLENANIICNKNVIAKDDVNTALDNPSGLRLGTQELTRLGMKEADMKIIAEFYERVIINEENPEKVREDVIVFRQKFKRIHYSFDPPK